MSKVYILLVNGKPVTAHASQEQAESKAEDISEHVAYGDAKVLARLRFRIEEMDVKDAI